MTVPSELGHSYSVRTTTVLARGMANALRMVDEINGSAVSPTSGVFTLIGPDGSTVSTGATATAGGVTTYTIPSGDLPSTLAFGEGYREVWTLTYTGGAVHTATRPAVLAKYPLVCPVTQSGLQAVIPNLSDLMRGNTSTLQPFIDTAWVDMVNRMMADGVLPHTLVDVNQLEAHLKYASLANAFRAFALGNPQNESWYRAAGDYERRAEAAYNNLARSRVDNDQNGIADSNDRESVSPILHLRGGNGWPYRTVGGGNGWGGL